MDRLLAQRRTPFVGRGRELAALQAALAAAGRGEGGVALITGEPGIGKTRLALELMQLARTRGWQVFFGRAYETEGAPPYLPFAEAVRDHVRTCPLDALEAQLAAGAAEVAVVAREVLGRFPRLADSPPLSPEPERYRLGESVSDFLLNIAGGAGSGLLLVLDDLQWADKPSLLLLQHLARRSAEGRLLIIGTYRRVETAAGQPLADVLADLSRDGLTQRIVLGSLSSEETVALIEGLIGGPPAPALADALAREAEGNPFFLGELVRHLQSEGRNLADPGSAPERWEVPEGVRQVIGKRLSRLGPPANGLLQVAAVAGDGFTVDLIEAASRLQPDELSDALDEALRADVIREDANRFQFSHNLIRQTIYRGLNAARRARLHRQVAEAIEGLYVVYPEPHLAELAHHLFQASGAEQVAKATGYARRAAERAVQLLAFEDAADLYALVLGAADDTSCPPAERCDLWLALGDARRRAGQLPAGMSAFQRAAESARSLGDAERLARASLGFEDALLAAGTPRQGPRDPSILLQRKALAALGPGPRALRARVLAALGRALHFSGLPDEAAAVTQQAVDLARAADDPGALACALNVQFIVLWGPDQPAERLALATDLVRSAEAAGDEELALEGRTWRLRTLLELGNLPAVEAESADYYQRAEALREPQYRALARAWQALLAVMRGAGREAGELLQQALGRSRAVQGPNLERLLTAARIDAARELGQLDQLSELRAQAERIAEQASAWRIVVALLDCDLGRQAEARGRFSKLAEGDYRDFLRHWLGLNFGARLAEICATLGDRAEAARLYALLLPYSQQYVVGGLCLGSVSRYLGLLAATQGRWQAARAHFDAAVQLNGAIGHRFQLAHTQRDYAVMLMAQGKVEDLRLARDYLEQAVTAYRELGAEHHADRARSRLADLPHRPAPGAAAPYPAGLTAREAQVLQLIAEGKTNSEIADLLVLSVRTVERHITNAYAKIDARGKADATAFALRHGLTAPHTPA